MLADGHNASPSQAVRRRYGNLPWRSCRALEPLEPPRRDFWRGALFCSSGSEPVRHDDGSFLETESLRHRSRRTFLSVTLTGLMLGFSAVPIGMYRRELLGEDWRLNELMLLALDAYSGAVIAVDAFKETVTGRTSILGDPTGILFSRSNLMLLVVDAVERRLTILRDPQSARTQTIDLNFEPTLASLSEDGSRIALADWSTGVLVILDSRDGREVQRFSGLEGAHGLLFNRDGTGLFIPIVDQPRIAHVDLHRMNFLPDLRLPVAKGVDRLVRTDDGSTGMALTPVDGDATVFVVDFDGHHSPIACSVPSPVARAVADYSAPRFYAASAWEPELYLLADSGELHATFHTGGPLLDEVVVVPGDGRVLGLSLDHQTALIFDPSGLSSPIAVDIPGAPMAMYIHSESRKAFFALADENAIGVLDLVKPFGSSNPPEVRKISLRDDNATGFAVTDSSGICHT